MSRFLRDGSIERKCHYCRSHFILSRFLEERNLSRHRFVDLFIVHFILLCFPRCECTILHLFLSNRRTHKDRLNSTCINSRTPKSFELTHPTSPPLPLTLPMESLSNPILQPALLPIPTLLNLMLPQPTLTVTLYLRTITLMVSNLPQTIKTKLVRMERRGIRLRRRYNINIRSW